MDFKVSVLTGGPHDFDTTSEHLNAISTDFLSGDGVVDAPANTAGVAPMTGGFAVNATSTPDKKINIGIGTAYVTATPTNQAEQRLRIHNDTVRQVTLADNATGATRYDFVYLAIDADGAAAPTVAGDNVASIVVSRSTSQSTDDGTSPTYGLLLAVVTVAPTFLSITNGNIKDKRLQVLISPAIKAIGVGPLLLNPLPAGWTDVASSSVTFTVAVPSVLCLNFSALLQVNNDNTATVRMLLDDNALPVTIAQHSHNANSGAEMHVTNTIAHPPVILAAGIHVLKMQAIGSATNSTAMNNGSWNALIIPT